MNKPTIRFYTETKPEHYVGTDIGITLKYKSNIESWKVKLILDELVSTLKCLEYPVDYGGKE